MTARVAERVFPTLTEPLLDRDAFRRLVGDDDAWKDLFERPIGELLERRFADDTVRGIVLTDALIGTFTHAHDRLPPTAASCTTSSGGGRATGTCRSVGWARSRPSSRRPPSGAAPSCVTGVEVVGVRPTATRATVTTRRRPRDRAPARCSPTSRRPCSQRCSATPPTAPPPEGAQVKVNMLLSRLPRLRDRDVDPSTPSPARSTSTRATTSSSRPTGRRPPARFPTSCRARSTATR